MPHDEFIPAVDLLTKRRRSANLEAVVKAIRGGEPVLVHDAADREGETDLTYPASAVDKDAVCRLRNDAGGRVCVALADSVVASWRLLFVQDTIDHPVA